MSTLRTIAQFSPSPFDRSIAAFPELSEREGWLVAPVGRNRDSDTLGESNWYAQLAALGGESETVEVHRFGHWACGWYEVVIVAPGSPAQSVCEDLLSRLGDYPALDEDDWGARETAAAYESWDRWSVIDMLEENAVNARTVASVRGLSLSKEQADQVLGLMESRGRIELREESYREYGSGRNDMAACLRLIRGVTRG